MLSLKIHRIFHSLVSSHFYVFLEKTDLPEALFLMPKGHRGFCTLVLASVCRHGRAYVGLFFVARGSRGAVLCSDNDAASLTDREKV